MDIVLSRIRKLKTCHRMNYMSQYRVVSILLSYTIGQLLKCITEEACTFLTFDIISKVARDEIIS